MRPEERAARGKRQDGALLPKLITIDGLLVEGIDKVAWILDGVLEVADGVHAASLAPLALLGSLGLVLQLAESDLVWAGKRHTQENTG